MIYSVQVEVERLPEKDEWDGEWIPLEALQAGRYVAELKCIDENGITRLWLDDVDENDIAFMRSVVKLSEITQAARKWRDAIQYTDGIRQAEAVLLKLLNESY